MRSSARQKLHCWCLSLVILPMLRACIHTVHCYSCDSLLPHVLPIMVGRHGTAVVPITYLRTTPHLRVQLILQNLQRTFYALSLCNPGQLPGPDLRLFFLSLSQKKKTQQQCRNAALSSPLSSPLSKPFMVSIYREFIRILSKKVIREYSQMM